MELSLSEKLTYCTVRLTCHNNADGRVSIGTGFILNVCMSGNVGVPLIVTNKHVVSGFQIVEFEFCLKNKDGTPDDMHIHSIRIENANWVFHPNPNVDLCCLPFAAVLNDIAGRNIDLFYIPIGLDLLPSDEIINKFGAMEEIVMIGYPIGIMDEYNHKPIIRKGITATHIKKKYFGKNEFLIDAACFPGSSGSPIFILNEGGYSYDSKLYLGSRVYFIGVLYGGPQYNADGKIVFSNIPTYQTKTNIPTNLGIAIRSNELKEFDNIFNLIISENNKKV